MDQNQPPTPRELMPDMVPHLSFGKAETEWFIFAYLALARAKNTWDDVPFDWIVQTYTEARHRVGSGLRGRTGRFARAITKAVGLEYVSFPIPKHMTLRVEGGTKIVSFGAPLGILDAFTNFRSSVKDLEIGGTLAWKRDLVRLSSKSDHGLTTVSSTDKLLARLNEACKHTATA